MLIKLAGIEHGSVVDGPGIRDVIFTQGCPHRCEGCHNPSTWGYYGGVLTSVADLYEEIIEDEWCNKITISGGEPLIQAEALLELVHRLKAHKEYEFMLYTGYIFDDETLTEQQRALLKEIDIVVDGPFEEDKKSLDLPFRGSQNQRIIDSKASFLLGKIVLYSVD